MRSVAICVLALVVAVASAQPYFYDDYDQYDLYDEYDLYSMNYNYDFFDDDYKSWDALDTFSKLDTKTDGKTTSSKELDPWEDDYYGAGSPYFSYYDDIYGDYSFDDPFEFEVDCVLDENKKPKFEGIPACDLVLEGADKVADLITGGVDGTYKVFSCENGRPLYKRENSPAGEDRVLWYSSTFRDWDLNNGTTINEDDILMYGGQGDSEMRPQFVPGQWHIASDLIKGYEGLEDYKAFDLTVKCSDGSTIEPPEKPAITVSDGFGGRPLLTDEEMEKQYEVVYKRAAKRAEGGDVNLGLVSLFVFIGLAIVFGLPFMVARNRRNRRGPRATATGRQEGGFKISSLMASNKKSEHTK